jgi:hypothetical protein
VHRETVPGLHPPLHSSNPVLDGEDGGLRYPKESIKLRCELGRLLGVFECFKSFMTLLNVDLMSWPKLTSALKMC